MRESPAGGPRFGAWWDGRAVRFSVPAPHAERVELCLFDAGGARETGRQDLARDGEGVWSASLDAIGPGQLYGYRAHGPFAPERGHRFDPSKLLVDPAAPAVSGTVTWHDALHSLDPESGLRNGEDSAPFAPRSRVVDPVFDWRGDQRPKTAWRDTLLYECHVRGATMRHPDVPAEHRGTYLGLAHPAVLEHLTKLGVTAIELLPVHHSTAERHLAIAGRVNYWGYSPLAWYAPHAGYATGDDGRQVDEFRHMVKSFHAAGIEVLIDVVLNHSCEGDARGPTLGLRGLGNETFYRTERETGDYVDWTGCGNTLDFGNPIVRDFALDGLRYWAEHLRVDGFRFDLAPVIGRTEGPFDPAAPFLEAIAADPVLAPLKRIAEPWDLGPDGYQLGGFPSPWREWNDRFRDVARGAWRGDPGLRSELVRRMSGSADLLARSGETSRSVNYVAAHDGFTLADLTRYEERHNEANGEENRDGHQHNLSRNWGVEGPTSDPEILELRERAARNLLATLLLADGTPMLSHGDELGRTQHGNNNAYNQDSATTWVDWDLDERRRDLLETVRALTALRAELRRQDRTEPWQEVGNADASPETPAEQPLALWKPAAGYLLVVHAGDGSGAVALPQPAASWSVRWTSEEGAPSIGQDALEVSPRSVTLLLRGD